MIDEPTLEEVKRVCTADGSNTLIFIVQKDTPLSAQLLGLLRDPDMLDTNAMSRFETGWALYEKHYAGRGGAFGALLCPQMKKNGPIMGLGESDQVASIARILIKRAREITSKNLTPIFFERAFETTVKAISAELQGSGGSA